MSREKSKTPHVMNLPPENNYWRRVTSGYLSVPSKTTGQLITSGLTNLNEVVGCAKLAGIPEKNWNLINMDHDWSGCYYEGDSPSIIWTFPLTVFED
jgi:hypothetical protein